MYNIIFVCKYRKNLLCKYDNIVKEIFFDIASKSDFEIIEMKTDKNHINILLKSQPKVSTLSIVNRLKAISTRNLWKNYEDDLKKYFWKEKTFWSDGYFVCSIGNVSKEIIEKYIQNQG